jgi:EpsI family protein
VTTATAERNIAPDVRRRPLAARDGFLLTLVVAALVFAHREALGAMVRQWNASPMYSYGFTVPFISAYLLWARRDAIMALTPRPSWLAGGAVLACGFFMLAAGRASGIQVLEQVAFLVSLTGVVLVLFGAPYVRVAWAALAYLLLMVPLWDGLTEHFHAPFQRRSAEMGVWMLRAIGIPAYREGVFIALPNLDIEVARACSGVNYLVAVLALGLPLAYLYLRDTWRRVVLLVSAVLVAALSNGARVALIGTLAYLEIGSPLHGPLHVLHGLFVAGVGYVVLFAGLRLLAPAQQATPSVDPMSPTGAPKTTRADSSRRVATLAAAGLAAVFLLVGSAPLTSAPHDVVLDGALEAFPDRLGDWVGIGTGAWPQPADTTRWPGADVEFRRRFRRADGATVDLFVAYFASQSQNKEIVNDRAAELHARATRVRVGADGGGFDANLVPSDAGRQELLFWYRVDARPDTNPYLVKARTLWSAIWRGDTHGAVVVLTPGAGIVESPAGALFEIAPLVEEALASRLPGGVRAGGA